MEIVAGVVEVIVLGDFAGVVVGIVVGYFRGSRNGSRCWGFLLGS